SQHPAASIARAVRHEGLLGRLAVPALALVTAFIVGAFILVVTDFEHLSKIGTDPLVAIGGALDVVVRGYGAMLTGSIGDVGRIVAAIQSGTERDVAKAIRPATEALLFTTPIIFVALGVGLALHARLFNFGAGGQFVMGGFGAVTAAGLLGSTLPPFAVLLLALATGTLSGAAYAFLPGLLKARTGAHEVITTLMFNSLTGLTIYLVSGALSGVDLRAVQPPKVPLLFDIETIRLDWGFVVALLMAVVVSFVLFRTPLGFELRATGFSPAAARAAGMRPGRATVIAMSMSGGLAGMGGAFLALGPAGGIEGTGAGFVALALALIAGLRPSGIVLACLLFGALNNGAKSMVIETGTPLDLLTVIIALALMFVAAPGLIRSIWRLKPPPMHDDPATFRPTADASPL
ncbi:MAG TPA: ABC transporter permease, partial [Candidatus Limnocylindrales bacterium]|nr:ABC transporter permease [Candidatus Limnocylindrales bacterium]